MKDIIRRAALHNAVTHEGQASNGPVMQKVMGENPEMRPRAKEIMAMLGEIVAQVNSLSLDEQQAEVEKLGIDTEKKRVEIKKGLPELKNADNVVMRFAPGPSGPLHIGHSRAVILNDEFCRKYKGKFILRFEDTNPQKIDPDAYKMIPEDLEWLGVEVHETYCQSDRMEEYYRVARELIEKGAGYVCLCEADHWRQLKNNCKPCPHRDLSVEETLAEFEKMMDGTYTDGEASFMVKTDLEHKNPAVRDFVGLRILKDVEHPRQGTKYHVYPLYNFSVAVDDHLMGCTHILRGKDHLNNTYRQEYVYDHLGWEKPNFIHYGFVSIPDVLLKTSSIKEQIKAGEFTGWDDVRLGTFRAVGRRGIRPEALREYWKEVGLKQVDITFSFKNLNSYNKKLIDPVSNRYFFIKEPSRVLLEVNEPLSGEAPKHPEDPEKGVRKFELTPEEGVLEIFVEKMDLEGVSPGEIVRLKDLCNIEVVKDGDHWKGVYKGNDTSNLKKGSKIFQWVCGGVPGTLLMPDGKVSEGIVEKNILDEDLDTVQFERIGFVRLEERSSEKVKAVFTQG